MITLRTLVLCLKLLIDFLFPKERSIAEVITQRYGPTTLHLFRNLEKTHFKYLRLQCDVAFLSSCYKHDLLPKFVQFRVYDRGLQSSRLYRNCQRRFLLNELRRKERYVQTASLRLDHLNQALKTSVSWLDFGHLYDFILRTNEKSINNVKYTHSKKLEKLGLSNNSVLPPDSVIFNFSDRILSSHEKEVLALGLKFSLPVKRPHFYKHFLSCERFFTRLSNKDCVVSTSKPQPSFNHSFKNLCLSAYYSYKQNRKDDCISSEQWAALKSLREDKSIVITKLDKGNGVVLLNKSDYIEKMKVILNDRQTFVPLSTDTYLALVRSEDKLNTFLRTLKSDGKISEATYHRLFTSGSKPGIMYGLPKVHKEGVPLRPILSARGTHTYNLAKHLVSVINPITTNEYTVQDSFSFVKELSDIDSSNTVMASFDIKSLFTNIPLDETIEICTNSLREQGLLPNNFLPKEFKKLLSMAVKDCIFLFNGITYKQVDGVAMGSPLGPAMANAFLVYHEGRWLDDCPTDFKPVLYRRYVDDTFLLFKSENHVPLFLEYLNGKHANIKFTYEYENNGKLPFLDVLVERSGSILSTSTYRKSTFTGLGMKYSSFIPSYYKTGLIVNLVNRAYKICSTYDSLDLELKFLTNYFVQNGFPENLVLSCIGKGLKKFFPYNPFNIRGESEHTVFSIPFYGKSSYAFKNKMTKLLKDFYPTQKFRIVFSKASTLGSFFGYKDRVPFDLQSSVVYNYICESCSASYVGKTVRHLKTRIAEHKGVSPRNLQTSKSPKFSAIREHSEATGHLIKTSSFSVLQSGNPLDLTILESLYTHNLKPSLSSHDSSTELVCF